MKKIKKRNEIGIVFIKCSFNNTIVTITDPYGNVVAWSSGGSCGFKNARKSTPFASKCASLIAAKQAGFEQVRVLISGPGPGRETAIRGLQQAGLQILLIRDRTSIPHNGCRPPKRRRV